MDIEKFKELDALIDNGEFKAAFKQFLHAAEAGDVDAMVRVAYMYAHGQGVSLDFDKSIYWDVVAIKKGSETALYNLGITYRMKGDLRKAKSCFEKSLQAGRGEAALQLAKLYLVSDKELEKVKTYLEIALDHEMCEASEEEAENLLDELER